MSIYTNQCQYCAFMLSEDQSTKEKDCFIEDKYRAIRSINNAPKKTRNIYVGGIDDRTETCFINSPMWIKRKDDLYCPDRLDNTLSLESALDLREARLNNDTARAVKQINFDAKIWGIIAVIIATIAIIKPIVSDWLIKN